MLTQFIIMNGKKGMLDSILVDVDNMQNGVLIAKYATEMIFR